MEKRFVRQQSTNKAIFEAAAESRMVPDNFLPLQDVKDDM